MNIRVALLFAIALAAVWPATAHARIVRYALLVGSNRGAADDPSLQYAARDAARVRDVLVTLGGYLPENVVALVEPQAASMRRVLIQLNERIRRDISAPDTQAVLFVYYSGHADAEALHLGASELELRELSGLVNGSAAQFRVLVLDACRSGAVTRRKGGRPAPAFAVALDERLMGEGAVFLTASADSEDAQESDALQGSFFTHYFVSGLLGAADEDENGQVSLAEVYQYTYAHTLRATSKSWAGTQHPMFRYQLAGQGDLAMSFPRQYGAERAELVFPEDRTYLVLRVDAEGSVVAEVSASDRARSLSVEPGHYFVRGRDRDALLEGELTASAGTRVDVGRLALDRVEYARLARKGGAQHELAQGPQLAYRVHTPLWKGDTLCQGALLGYSFDFAAISVSPRFTACAHGWHNAQLSARSQELGLELRVAHAWDPWPRLSVDLGLVVGAELGLQQFESAGSAPARASLAGQVGVGPGFKLMLTHGLHVLGELSVLTQLVKSQDRKSQQLMAAPLLALTLGLGLYF